MGACAAGGTQPLECGIKLPHSKGCAKAGRGHYRVGQRPRNSTSFKSSEDNG